jgi:hypothetical protein
MSDMYTKQQNLDISEKRVHETDISLHEPWDTSDMAHRSGGLTVEQAEKQTHTDHPMRHWDRTCPACVAEAEQQEPVGWFAKSWQGVYVELMPEAEDAIPFYTAPPKRKWVGLTDEEVHEAAIKCVKSGQSVNAAIRAIEFKLRERNT